MENFVGVGAGSFLAEEITDLHIAAKRHPARPGPCQRVIGWMQDVPNAGSQILACQISTRAADAVKKSMHQAIRVLKHFRQFIVANPAAKPNRLPSGVTAAHYFRKALLAQEYETFLLSLGGNPEAGNHMIANETFFDNRARIAACQISTRAADNVGSQILVGGKFVEERNFFFFIQWLTIYPLPNVES